MHHFGHIRVGVYLAAITVRQSGASFNAPLLFEVVYSGCTTSTDSLRGASPMDGVASCGARMMHHLHIAITAVEVVQAVHGGCTALVLGILRIHLRWKHHTALPKWQSINSSLDWHLPHAPRSFLSDALTMHQPSLPFEVIYHYRDVPLLTSWTVMHHSYIQMHTLCVVMYHLDITTKRQM
jgi:hypothetical protein